MDARPREDARLLPWDAFRATFLEPGLSADIPIMGEPSLTLYLDAARPELGLRIPDGDADMPESQLSAFRIYRRLGEIVVVTDEAALFQPFYFLLLDIADRVQLDRTPPARAIQEALRAWRRLLAEVTGLSAPEQIGLLGELWLLERVLTERGPAMLEAWTGPAGEAHDFRWANREIEVKATTGERRTHRITRLDQLQASPSCDLWLLSLHFARTGPGQGISLPEQIESVRVLLRPTPGPLDRFETLLAAHRWRDEDASTYTQRFQPRSRPRLMPVGPGFPRITPFDVAARLGPDASRLGDVEYTINVEGLGVGDGTSAFADVLGLGRQ